MQREYPSFIWPAGQACSPAGQQSGLKMEDFFKFAPGAITKAIHQAKEHHGADYATIHVRRERYDRLGPRPRKA